MACMDYGSRERERSVQKENILCPQILVEAYRSGRPEMAQGILVPEAENPNGRPH